MSDTQQSITAALARHSLAEIEAAVRQYRNALGEPVPDIAALKQAHVALGLSPADIAVDLSAHETAAAIRREIEAVTAAADSARSGANIDADLRAVTAEMQTAMRPFHARLAALGEERSARTALDTRAEELQGSLVNTQRRSPRLFAEDVSVAAQHTPRGRELIAWAGKGLGAGRAVPTATQE